MILDFYMFLKKFGMGEKICRMSLQRLQVFHINQTDQPKPTFFYPNWMKFDIGYYNNDGF